MKIVRRVVAEKRLLVTVIAVMLVAAGALYILAVYPLSVRADAVRERRAAARQALVTAQRNYTVTRVAADDQGTTSEALEQFYRDVLPPDLAAARGITYPRLAALARSHGLVLERRSSVPEQDDDSELRRLRTTMLLAGDWADIRRFIDTLENAPEFLVIEEIALSQSEEVGASLVLTLGVSTYFRSEDAT